MEIDLTRVCPWEAAKILSNRRRFLCSSSDKYFSACHNLLARCLSHMQSLHATIWSMVMHTVSSIGGRGRGATYGVEDWRLGMWDRRRGPQRCRWPNWAESEGVEARPTALRTRDRGSGTDIEDRSGVEDQIEHNPKGKRKARRKENRAVQERGNYKISSLL
jgi:hypothetical protein